MIESVEDFLARLKKRDPDQPEFENSQRAAGLMRDFGVERRVVSTDEVIAIEPALAPHRNTIVGGDYTPEDESGDVHLFTVALAERCARAGVEFRRICQVCANRRGDGKCRWR